MKISNVVIENKDNKENKVTEKMKNIFKPKLNASVRMLQGALLIGAAVASSFLAVSAYSSEEITSADGNWTYRYDEKGDGESVDLVKYVGSSTTVTVPTSVDGHPVCHFEAFTFAKTDVVSVTIPKEIPLEPKEPNLTGLFEGAVNLSEVNLDESVTEIPAYCFKGCTSLKSLPALSHITDVGTRAFLDAGLEGDIVLTDANVISLEAFSGTNITSIKATCAEDKNIVVESSAFRKCEKLESAYLMSSGTVKNGVYGIPKSLFSGCAELKSVTFTGSDIKTVDEYAFYGCKQLATPNLPDTLEKLDKFAFFGCEKLSSIPCQDKLVYIGLKAFMGCTSLNDCTLTKCKVIEESAFSESGITKVSLPSAITEIKKETFKDCASLGIVVFDATSLKVEESAFEGCVSLKATQVDKMDAIGKKAFSGCASLQNFTFSPDLKEISESAFEGCLSLTKLEKGQMTKIGKSAFYGCTGLESVGLSHDIESIDDRAFAGCTKLATFEFDDDYLSNINHFGRYVLGKDETACKWLQDHKDAAFEGDIALFGKKVALGCLAGFPEDRNLVIPEGVTVIAGSAFEYKYDAFDPPLASVKLPSTLRVIGRYAFAGHPCFSASIHRGHKDGDKDQCKWTSIVIPKNVECIEDYAFAECFGIQTMTFESGSKLHTLGDYAFKDLIDLTSIVLPDGVTVLPNDLFFKCESLKEITLPKYLEEIGDSAFYNCSSLLKLEIPETVSALGGMAFRGCRDLREVVIPKNVTEFGSNDEGYEPFADNSLTIIVTPVGSAAETFFAQFEHTQLHQLDCGLRARVEEDGAIMVAGGNPVGELIIPGMIFGQPVTTINKNAIDCSNAKSVSIPDSVTTIADQALVNVPKDFVVMASANSAAAAYAKKSGITLGNPVKATSIRVDRANWFFVDCSTFDAAKTNEPLTLHAFVGPNNVTDGSVTWSSSNEELVTVGQDGVVRYLGGYVPDDTYVTVTATTNDGTKLTASCKIAIINKEDIERNLPSDIYLKDASVKVGESVTLTPTFKPEDTGFQYLNWEVEDPSIAVVEDGVVYGLKAGTTKVTASCDYDSTVSASCTITVIAAPKKPAEDGKPGSGSGTGTGSGIGTGTGDGTGAGTGDGTGTSIGDQAAESTVAKVKSFKLTAKKKSLKLTWKKMSGIKGYQIQVSTSKKFTKKTTKKYTAKASAKSKTIKKLKAKKKYYVRIRAYKKVGNKTIYGAWVKTSKKTK